MKRTAEVALTAPAQVNVNRLRVPSFGLASFALGPNPAGLRTDLRFSLRQTLRAKLRLVDVQGREVWGSPEQSYAPGEHVLACALQSLAPGLYFMRFEHGSESRSARLVVIR